MTVFFALMKLPLEGGLVQGFEDPLPMIKAFFPASAVGCSKRMGCDSLPMRQAVFLFSAIDPVGVILSPVFPFTGSRFLVEKFLKAFTRIGLTGKTKNSSCKENEQQGETKK